MGCLENLIGLSQKACDCFDVDDSTSDSGLWLDELEGLNLRMIDAGKYCEPLTEFMVKAKNSAINSLKADLMSNLRSKYKPRFQPFLGLLGQQSYKKNLTPSTSFVGIQLSSVFIKGTKLKIKRIGININESKTVTINGYKRIGEDENDNSIIDGSFTFTTTINSIANTWTYKTLDTPKVIDLWEDGLDCLSYLIGYEPTTEKYKDNQIDCGCGNREKYINQYIVVNGVYGTTSDYNTSTNAHGLILDVEIVCESDQIICNNLVDLDFQKVLANALRYKAGFFLAIDILNSPNGDTYTNAVNPEQLFANAQGYETQYQDRVKSWLTDNLKLINNDCYICSGTKIGKIRL